MQKNSRNWLAVKFIYRGRQEKDFEHDSWVLTVPRLDEAVYLTSQVDGREGESLGPFMVEDVQNNIGKNYRSDDNRERNYHLYTVILGDWDHEKVGRE